MLDESDPKVLII